MRALAYEEAFKRYQAKLRNVQWSVCAETPQGELVISCWQHRLKLTKEKDKWRYTDYLSRWSGSGNNELAERLVSAHKEQQTIKLVIAVAKDAEQIEKIENGVDGSKVKKDFYVRPEMAGKIVQFDGENFVIEFAKVE